MSSKKIIARLCTAFLVFFSCAGWKKQELAESFDWEKEILTRRGYHYQKTNDYEELDTGKMVSKLEVSENGKRKHTSIVPKESEDFFDKAKRKRQTYNEGTIDSIVEYIDDDHISNIKTDNQSIDFVYDDQRNLVSVVLNGKEMISVNSSDGKAEYSYANGTSSEVTIPNDDYAEANGEAISGFAEHDLDGNILHRTDEKNGIDYSYNVDENGNTTAWISDDISYEASQSNTSISAYGGFLKQIMTDEDDERKTISEDYSTDSDSAIYTLQSEEAVDTELINGNELMVTDSSERENGSETFSSPFGEKTFFYDETGKLTETDYADGSKTEYEYDAIGRIKDIRGREEEHYEYDNAGNIVSRTQLGISHSYQYSNGDDQNQMTSADSSSALYDDYGNLVSYKNMSLEWADGNILKKYYDGEKEVLLGYTPDGIRVLKNTDKEGLTFYGYCEGKLLVSYSTRKGLLLYSYDGNGKPKALSYNGKLYFFVHDPQGNIEGLVDSHGAPAVEYSYSTYGVPKITAVYNIELAEANQILYKDYVYDWDRGLYYLMTRYYSPELMRFISRDDLIRISENGLNDPCYNLYAYALDNPLSFSDKSGCLAVEVAAASIYEVIAGIALTVLAIFLLKAIVSYCKDNFPSDVLLTGLVDKTKWDLYRVIKEVGEIIIFTTAAVTLSSWAKWIRRNRTAEDHHIIAQKAIRAYPARNIWLNKCYKKIDDSPNVISLKYELHRHLHTGKYYRAVNIDIINAYAFGLWNGNAEEMVIKALYIINIALADLNREAPF